jgi:hypothetical protein
MEEQKTPHTFVKKRSLLILHLQLIAEFVSPVEQVISIQTGEKNVEAV